MDTRKALIVIDMQKGLFTTEAPAFDTDGVVNKINFLSQKFRELGWTVIFIQHDGTAIGRLKKGSKEWEQLNEINVSKADVFIDKYANDVFYKSDLESTLNTLNINNIYIAGYATDFCVESTIQTALTKEFNITVVKDGHTTSDKPHIKAEKIIEHYNWIWENMIPTKGEIKVKSFNEIINNLSNVCNTKERA